MLYISTIVTGMWPSGITASGFSASMAGRACGQPFPRHLVNTRQNFIRYFFSLERSSSDDDDKAQNWNLRESETGAILLNRGNMELRSMVFVDAPGEHC